MKLLLDTHVWLWAIADHHRLNDAARDAIEDPENVLHVSATSWWELARLSNRGVVDVDGDLGAWVAFAMQELPAIDLPITSAIAMASEQVELDNRDPADRFLAATAIEHELILVTRDRALLDATGVPTLEA